MSILEKPPALPLRRLGRVVALVAIAMAAGHLIQTLAARKSAVAASVVTNGPKDIVQLSAGADNAPVIVFVRPGTPVDSLSAATTMERTREAAETTPVQVVCADDLALEAQPGGMIDVALSANCRSGQRIVLRHAGLAVTGKIAADGTYQTVLPALSVAEAVEILFQDGSKTSQIVSMPEVAAMRRFGVQWQGVGAFAIQSFENGADLGQADVISVSNPGAAQSGVMTLLGDASVENPLMAQIYTYPANPLRSTQVVVEAAVTGQTCGHDLLGDVIFSEAGQARTVDLTLAMPDCSGIGDFLVLKNLATDLKIAAN